MVKILEGAVDFGGKLGQRFSVGHAGHRTYGVERLVKGCGIAGVTTVRIMSKRPEAVCARSTWGRSAGAGAEAPFTVFGPTWGSLDRLPGAVELPQSNTEGD